MTPDNIKWVCQFQVEDPQRHRNGFTVYKLTSVRFSRNNPKVATKHVVWKRFNDFKKLYEATNKSCKRLNISGPPALSSGAYFNRFEDKVVKQRVRSAQALLNFIGDNKVLFLGEEFKFFCAQGYKVNDQGMGQGESLSCEPPADLHLDESHWRWTDESKWKFETSESSDDESGPASTESGGSAISPTTHNNNMENRLGLRLPEDHCCNNNAFIINEESELQIRGHLPRDDSIEVLDIAGGGDKILSPLPDAESEVVCRSERPAPVQNIIWLLQPSPEQRLAAYRVVAIFNPLLVVVHSSRPDVRLALKVLRKSSWPVVTVPDIGEPRPVPHMVRLIDWIETDDAVFVVTELVTSGRLIDHVRQIHDAVQDTNQERAGDSLIPNHNLDVDALVLHSQRLLASVSRTLERSAAQHQELKTAESVLETRGRKPRSKSVLPRARLERRFSSDDATGPRPRTAHGSLERVARRRLTKAPEASVREWGAAIVAGLDTLHTRGLVWKDLHQSNLLWGNGGRPVLTFHHSWRGVEPPLNTAALNGFFVAPEVLSVFPVTSACDWWSVGVLLYELLTGVPLAEAHPNGLGSHTALELPSFLSIEAQSLLTSLLQVSPKDRLGGGTYGSEEIKCHPFFNTVDWDQIYNLL